MDPTTSAHTNPFVSPPTSATLPSELSDPKPVSASATDPAAINSGTAGLSGIVPLSETATGFNTAPGAGTASQPHSGGTTSYTGLGNVRDSSYETKQTAQGTAQDFTSRASATTQDAANKVSATTQDAANNARGTAQNISNKTSATVNDAATGIRQRVRKLSVQLDNAADHPAVKNAKGVANRNVSQLREQLGRSKTIRELEARTGVDRVVLVVGGVLGYLLLVPLNLFGLALPITNILTILPAAYLAAEILDSNKADANDERVKQLLAYFVVLGLIQTTESLAAGVLERRIPQYYTVKLLALAYLLHPQTNGAMKVHENVFHPIVQRASAGSKSSQSYSSGRNDIYNNGSNTVSTPPTSKPSLSTVNSPAQHPTAQTSGYSLADAGTAVGSVPVVVQVPLTADVASDLRSQAQY